MKIRLLGTHDECDAVAVALKTVLAVHEVSDWYPNRAGGTVLGRMNIEAEPALTPHTATDINPACGEDRS